MACGKYLSLEEARRQKRLDRFCKGHPTEGDGEAFEELLEPMAKGVKEGNKHDR